MIGKIFVVILFSNLHIIYVMAYIKVVDGDTLIIDGRRIRMQGIDAPEIKQECIANNGKVRIKIPCGQISRYMLKHLIGRDKVRCTNEGTDKYKRQLAYCFVNQVNLNREMVRFGYAYAYSEYDKSFVKEEVYARANKFGFWDGEFPKPSIYRGLKRKNRLK